MAKKIKFPLQMKNDAQVRDLDELREHFDLDKAIGYFLDGKLLSWLEARYYDTEADAVRALNKDDADVHRRLCEIFGVEYHAEEAPKIDVEVVEERNRRLGELKQYTSDPAVLEKVDQVAFNQEELADLIDEGYSDIYLCNNSFVIPLRVRNKHYIGIGKAEAVIRSQERVDFEEFGIRFDDVKFDEAYEKLTHETPEELYRKGREAEDRQDYTTALEYFKKAADANNRDGLFKLGWFYDNGYGVTQDYQESMQWYQKAADLGDMWAMNNIGVLFDNGKGVTQNSSEARTWFEKAAKLGNSLSMSNIGCLYEYGRGVMQDYSQALQWYKKAAEAGSSWALYKLGKIYSSLKYRGCPWSFYVEEGAEEQSVSISVSWFTKAANAGHIESMMILAQNYSGIEKYKDDGFKDERIIAGYRQLWGGYGGPRSQDLETAKMWYEKAIAAGNSEAQGLLTQLKKKM